MKTLLFSLTILLLVACNKSEDTESSNRNCVDVEYGVPFNLKVGSSACLSDGRMIKLLSVEDQFCPCGVVCDWGGQLLLNIALIESDGTTKVQPLSISDSNTSNSTFEDINTSALSYIYEGQTDILPLCIGLYNQDKITMVFTLSE